MTRFLLKTHIHTHSRNRLYNQQLFLLCTGCRICCCCCWCQLTDRPNTVGGRETLLHNATVSGCSDDKRQRIHVTCDVSCIRNKPVEDSRKRNQRQSQKTVLFRSCKKEMLDVPLLNVPHVYKRTVSFYYKSLRKNNKKVTIVPNWQLIFQMANLNMPICARAPFFSFTKGRKIWYEGIR